MVGVMVVVMTGQVGLVDQTDVAVVEKRRQGGVKRRDVCGGRGPAMSPAGRRALPPCTPCRRADALRHETRGSIKGCAAAGSAAVLRAAVVCVHCAVRNRTGERGGIHRELPYRCMRDDDAQHRRGGSGWIGDEREKGEGGDVAFEKMQRGRLWGRGRTLWFDLVVVCEDPQLCVVQAARHRLTSLVRVTTDLCLANRFSVSVLLDAPCCRPFTPSHTHPHTTLRRQGAPSR